MTMSDRVITPEATLSYPNLFEPRAGLDGQEPKYSTELIFAGGTDLGELKAAAQAVAVAKWGDNIPKNLRSPFRDGDMDREGKPEYEGSTFISAKSKQRPVILYGPDRRQAEPDEVYPGCVARVSVTPFAYDVNGNKGVSFFLNNVWVLRGGDMIGGRGGDDFATIEVDASAFGEEVTPF